MFYLRCDLTLVCGDSLVLQRPWAQHGGLGRARVPRHHLLSLASAQRSSDPWAVLWGLPGAEQGGQAEPPATKWGPEWEPGVGALSGALELAPCLASCQKILEALNVPLSQTP